MTTFNNLQALATAGIYCTQARCNDTWSRCLESRLEVAMKTEATPVFFTDGQRGREFTTGYKGYKFTVTENFTTGQFMLTIKN